MSCYWILALILAVCWIVLLVLWALEDPDDRDSW
jgi:hypothetical protein